jgi:hypothetical protein
MHLARFTRRTVPALATACLLLGTVLTTGAAARGTATVTTTHLAANTSTAHTPPHVDDRRDSRTLPPRSVRHRNSRFWVWFAPRNWTSVDSKQGITITSGDGSMTIDDGFSSILCANGQTMDQSIATYFAQQRAALRASIAAVWGNPRMEASRIRQLPAGGWGALYFRQVLQISGNAGGIPLRGVIQLDYSLATGPQYCFARSTAMTAPAQAFALRLSQLRSVHASKAYFGPGLPPGPNGEPA